MRKLLLCILTMGFMASALQPAWAQTDQRANREREILRRAQQQIQKSSQELAAMQEKANAAETEKTALSVDLKRAQEKERNESGARQRLQRDAQALTVERDQLKDKSAQQSADIQTLTAKISTLESDLSTVTKQSQDTQSQAAAQQARLSTQQQQLTERIGVCEKSNAKLYATGRDLVDQCRDRSVSDRVLRLEPFTGLGRVEMENKLEGIRDQLDSGKLPVTP